MQARFRVQKSAATSVFFYGLFMDQQLLEAKGVHPTDIRLAVVPGFVLRIGARAALVPTPASQVHGLLMKLSHADIEKLYAEPSVRAYRPESVLAVTAPNDTAVAARCYNLPEPRRQSSVTPSML